MSKPNKTESYNPELKQMIEKLSEVSHFIAKYCAAASSKDTHIILRVSAIDDCLSEAAKEISELISIEVMDNVFNK